jgi:hypothetical protein
MRKPGLVRRTSLNMMLAGCTVLTVWLLLVALGGASSALVGAEDELTATPAPRGVILFEDDFATYSGRWRESESPKALVAYQDAALAVIVASPGVYSWSVPDFDATLRDYRIEVTATVQGGSADSLVGLVLDYQGDEHFYALLTTTQGEWMFLRRQGDAFEDLTPPDVSPLDLTPHNGPLRLRADVIDSEVTLWIDDQAAGSVTAADGMSGGDFGLIARAGHGYVDVSFDNIVVAAIAGDTP